MNTNNEIDLLSPALHQTKEWQDWRWQLQHRLTKRTDFEKYLLLSDDETQGLDFASKRFLTGVTPHTLTIMDREDPECPIRKQYIPNIKEQYTSQIEMSDPCGEDQSSPVPGIVHRYPDRVLFLATDVCAVYCRYCTRSRLVGHKSGFLFNETIQRGLEYIRGNKKIRDVLISGGDPLLFSDEKLDALLGALRDIPHVEFLRLGSRIPVALPQRITPELCNILEKHHPFFMSIHVNHPKELVPEVKEATARLCKAGVPLGSQTVLLKGVNDSPEIMKQLVHKLLTFRVKPYYLYQCDPIKGSSHFRTSIKRGMEILRKLRGHTTGYAIPTYVVDGPGGGGKIPIEPSNVVSQKDSVIRLRNWAGKIYEYHEETDPAPIPVPKVDEKIGEKIKIFGKTKALEHKREPVRGEVREPVLVA